MLIELCFCLSCIRCLPKQLLYFCRFFGISLPHCSTSFHSHSHSRALILLFFCVLLSIFNFIILVKRIERVEWLCRCRNRFLFCWIVFNLNESFGAIMAFVDGCRAYMCMCMCVQAGTDVKSHCRKKTFFYCFHSNTIVNTTSELLKLNKLYRPSNMQLFFFILSSSVIWNITFIVDVIFNVPETKTKKYDVHFIKNYYVCAEREITQFPTHKSGTKKKIVRANDIRK